MCINRTKKQMYNFSPFFGSFSVGELGPMKRGLQSFARVFFDLVNYYYFIFFTPFKSLNSQHKVHLPFCHLRPHVKT